MQKFDGISFLWAVGLLAIIALCYGLRAFIGYRNVARDAEEDYAYKQERSMLNGELSKEGYIRVFKRLHSPRSSAYIASGLLAILFLTWPVMGILSFILEQLYQLTGRNRVFEPGFLVWQFCIFFGVIFAWTSIAYTIARRYHKLAPGTPSYEMEQQILEEQTGFREKVIYENDLGIPPSLVGIGFLLYIVFIIFWKFF